jgi:predicted Fe-Mo cluster-binding NifX family protein
MKIAFTSKGTSWDSEMDPRFGRTDYLFIFNEIKGEFTVHDNRETAEAAHGVGPQTAQKLSELQPDVLITGNGPGGNASRIIERLDITVYTGALNMTVKEAYEAYQNNVLTKF